MNTRAVIAFMDYPWQEDAEIELVGLMEEYREQILADVHGGSTVQYLKNLADANDIHFNQRFSENFLEAYLQLIGRI